MRTLGSGFGPARRAAEWLMVAASFATVAWVVFA
jgi:hypothetical protein